MPRRSDLDRAAASMIYYRNLGLNPVPSRMAGKKAPIVKFRQFWNQPGPKWWNRVGTTNIQVMTGCRWRLAVIDLDGPQALEIFRAWSLYREIPPTWEVATDPAKGKHLWFRTPIDLTTAPTRVLWQDLESNHATIEFKCDKALITAPPSIHIKTGLRYDFLPGRDPVSIVRPALIPRWLLSIAIKKPEPIPFVPLIPARTFDPSRRFINRYDFRHVFDSIADKVSLVRGWGLRVLDESPDDQGWLKCRAVGREDLDPSAGFNINSGCYFEPGTNTKLGLYQIAVATGAYPDCSTACNDLGERYLGATNSEHRRESQPPHRPLSISPRQHGNFNP